MVLSPATPRLHLVKAEPDAVRRIRDAAARQEPKVRAAIIEGLNRITREIGSANLEKAIASGNLAQVWDLLSSVADFPQETLNAIRDATVTAAVQGGALESAKFNIAFNDVNARAVRWAQANAGREITGTLTATTRAVIQNIIEDALVRGLHPRDAKKQIARVVPLTDRKAKLFELQRQALLDAGASPGYVNRLMDRKTAKAIRYRAQVIARTEMLRAANEGQQLVWEAAHDLGYIPEGTQKVWVVTDDDRTCDICEPMDGVPVEFRDSFTVTQETSKETVTSTRKTPPAHPQCRCAMVLETVSVAGSGRR